MLLPRERIAELLKNIVKLVALPSFSVDRVPHIAEVVR